MKNKSMLRGGGFVAALLTGMLLTPSLAQAQQSTTMGDDADVYDHYNGGYFSDTGDDDWFYDYYDWHDDAFETRGQPGTEQAMPDATKSDQNLDTYDTQPNTETENDTDSGIDYDYDYSGDLFDEENSAF